MLVVARLLQRPARSVPDSLDSVDSNAASLLSPLTPSPSYPHYFSTYHYNKELLESLESRTPGRCPFVQQTDIYIVPFAGFAGSQLFSLHLGKEPVYFPAELLSVERLCVARAATPK